MFLLFFQFFLLVYEPNTNIKSLRRAHEATRNGDFEEFKKCHDISMTTVTSDAPNQVIEGLNFHQFILDHNKSNLKQGTGRSFLP